MLKIVFALSQYALLAAFLFACWGLGRSALRAKPAFGEPQASAWQTVNPLAVALGMGVFICALQGAALLGWLTPSAVFALVGVGVVLGGVQVLPWLKQAVRTGQWHAGTPRSAAEKGMLAAVMLVALPSFVVPLNPPLAWDELMYHLPHAREWALSGRLQVNEWLRYPWFPYNFDLLFAGALVIGNDTLPHLLHAATGWTTAWLIYRLGVQHLSDRVAAGLAVVIWFALTRREYGIAYVDMSVAMFVLASCAMLQEWCERGARSGRYARRWVVVGALLLGVAAGTKYQVLALLPFFAIVLVAHDRRPGTWLLAVLALLLPCIFWYGRNALLTGDPFNPVGGRLFGFTDWNLADYQAQFADLRKNAGWPHWLLWGALIVPLVPRLRQQPAVRHALLASCYMVVAWAASSRYPRYLMFAFPLLALLAAAAWCHLARQASGRLRARVSEAGLRTASRLTCGALLALLAVYGVATSARHWTRIAATPEAREAVLQSNVTGYGVWQYLRLHPQQRIYQMGLEDALYYAPRPIWGEIFGPWRYRDFMHLAPQDLHRKLVAGGFDAFAIHTGRMPGVSTQTGFERYFAPLHTDGLVQLYRLVPNPTP